MSLIKAQLAERYATHETTEEEKAVTIRPASTALFVVDSSDRYESVVASRGGVPPGFYLTSPYQFNISRNQSLLNGFFTRLAVTEVTFPFYLPNVNQRTSTLYFEHSVVGAPATATLTIGFYTPSELASAVQVAIVAAGGVGTIVTYNNLGQFVIDAGVGNTITIFPGTNPPNLSSTEQFQLCDMMGFDNFNALNVAQVQTSRITRARYTEYIDIVCTQLTYNQSLKDAASEPKYRDVLARIYLETENDQPIPVLTDRTPGTGTSTRNTIPGTYPFTIYRQFKTPKQIQWNKAQPIGNLVFEVYDDKGEILTASTTASGVIAPNQAFPDWRMSLLVTEN